MTDDNQENVHRSDADSDEPIFYLKVLSNRKAWPIRCVTRHLLHLWWTQHDVMSQTLLITRGRQIFISTSFLCFALAKQAFEADTVDCDFHSLQTHV